MTQYEIEYGDDREIGLYFDIKPNSSYRQMLKSLGWRWCRWKACWDNYLSEETERFAKMTGIERNAWSLEERLKCVEEDEIDIENYTFASEMVQCPNCGEVIYVDYNYECPSCGAPMSYVKHHYAKVEAYQKFEQRMEEYSRQEKEKEKIRKEEAERKKREEKELQIKQREERFNTFKKEFPQTALLSEQKVRDGFNYLEYKARRISYANYMIDNMVVQGIGIDKENRPFFRLYISQTENERQYF